MRPLRHLFAPALLLAMLIATFAVPAVPSAAQSAQRCFPETGFCIEGRIREFWEQNGGLSVFGLPIGPQQEETIEGKQLQVQRFERNRLELHPQNARPNDVLLGRLGADRLAQQGRDWQTFPRVGGAPAGCLFFAETGHTLCEPFLSTFRANGLELDGGRGKSLAESVALFGLPLSEPQIETLSDGKNYTVQWFERARFESHPENAPPYNVLLGLLGNEIRAGGQAPAPQPAPQPTDSCADVPEPVNARIRPGKCVAPDTEMAIDIFGFRPGEQIGFWLTRPDGEMYGTVETYNVGPTGAVNDLPFDTSDMEPGLWFWVFEGTASGHKAIVYFKVLGEAARPAQPWQPAQLPPAQNAAVSPERGRSGTRFDFSANGFTPGERIGVYITAPDRSVFGAPFQTTADGAGVSEEVYFDTAGLGQLPAGVWALTFEGVDSGHKGTAYFEIQP
jgi:hypothetical protein